MKQTIFCTYNIACVEKVLEEIEIFTQVYLCTET